MACNLPTHSACAEALKKLGAEQELEKVAENDGVSAHLSVESEHVVENLGENLDDINPSDLYRNIDFNAFRADRDAQKPRS